jgi:hypothetical protein
MRPLDWLTTGAAVLAIASRLGEQFAAGWRDHWPPASGAALPDNPPCGRRVEMAPPGPRIWSARPVAGRTIAAGEQQLNSPRFSCSPAGKMSRVDWDGVIGQPAAPPQPRESWPQPSLN